MTKSETILETDRLILQTWTQADLDALFPILHDVEVVRYLSDGKPFSLDKTKDFLVWAEKYQSKNGFCRWKVIEKKSLEIIGSCGFARLEKTSEIELGFLLSKKFWNKAFAAEMIEAATIYGFNKLDFREIIALTDPENTASHKTLKKNNFKIRGVEIFGGKENLVFIKKKSDE